MTIPITPDYFLVQNQLHLATGLPEDVVVNAFIFRNTNQAGGTVDPAEQRAAEAVRDFFIESPAGVAPFADATASSIMGLLSPAITEWTQKVYNLGLPPGGRPPVIFNRTPEMDPRSAGNPFPNEVAIVCSLQTPIIGRRGRGRIYLGPVTATSAVATASGPQIASPVRSRICVQASKLALGNGKDMEWAVWSTTRSQMARVVGGWVDDDFDTQRRRGLESTARTLWGTTTPTVQP